MGAAIGFGMLVVVFAVFLPGVLHALEVFLLVIFEIATELLRNLPPA
jgi:hypothetical protein